MRRTSKSSYNTISFLKPSGYSSALASIKLESRFRFREVRNGKVSFAEVVLWIEPTEGSSSVKIDLLDTSGIPEGRKNAWSGAARKGVSDSMRILRRHRWANPASISIKDVVGNISDTRSDAIECAAAIALWNALAADHPSPQIIFDKRFRLDFPVAA